MFTWLEKQVGVQEFEVKVGRTGEDDVLYRFCCIAVLAVRVVSKLESM